MRLTERALRALPTTRRCAESQSSAGAPQDRCVARHTTRVMRQKRRWARRACKRARGIFGRAADVLACTFARPTIGGIAARRRACVGCSGVGLAKGRGGGRRGRGSIRDMASRWRTVGTRLNLSRDKP
jgi:hypothetical protein